MYSQQWSVRLIITGYYKKMGPIQSNPVLKKKHVHQQRNKRKPCSKAIMTNLLYTVILFFKQGNMITLLSQGKNT